IDATLIRGVVLPAAMKLLGKWNWYMPRSLAWVPSFGHGEGRALQGAAA
ncbi:MAG: putative drug exporter of the superfamily, partial [Gaiellales bacterium]|nr:putative drug exporter of the superfamily [Gaiellales bacterium]